MRVVHVLSRPGGLVAVATAVAVVVLTFPAVVTGVAGALTGLLAAVVASQVGLFASVLTPGVALRRLVIGTGPRVADWSTPHRIVTLRAVPLILSVSVRAATVARIRVAALCGLAFEVALAAGAVLVATGPFTRGFAAAAVASMVVSLIPKRTATTTSTGWLLFCLPRSAAAAPLVDLALRAAQDGDLENAERLAAQLRTRHPELRSALAARIAVLAAQGRYAEAVVLAVRLTSGPADDPDAFAVLAGLACATVETGQLDTEVGLSTASQAIENATALGYPNHRLNSARAMVALLRGDLTDAITLASMAAGAADDTLRRADDLATLARAHMAAGDNRSARRVLTEAEKLCRWWPRVATTRTRLEVAG